MALAGYATAGAAQTAGSGQGAAVLPPVTVEAPKQRTQPRATASRGSRAARSDRPRHAANRNVPSAPPHAETVASRGSFRDGNGPIKGYVAHRTLAGTKTNTSILEVPQSMSVIGADQIRDQGARSVVQAIGYTPGIVTNSPNDTRFESIWIRGFQAQLFLDGMRLPYGAATFGQPKLDLALLERVEVLRGPSSSLYGQAPPGGFVNMVSKLPTATPLNSFELLADNWGKVQANFDVGGVGAVNQKGDLFWRIAGTVHGGGTQVDFVNDFRGAIAPSITYKPDLDTTFTFLGGYQRDITGLALQFMPAVGTLYANPNGRIPLTKFLGEPGFDHFDRTQAWVGYQFEHSFNEVWTVRQNVRYFDLQTNTYAVAGAAARWCRRRCSRICGRSIAARSRSRRVPVPLPWTIRPRRGSRPARSRTPCCLASTIVTSTAQSTCVSAPRLRSTSTIPSMVHRSRSQRSRPTIPARRRIRPASMCRTRSHLTGGG